MRILLDTTDITMINFTQLVQSIPKLAGKIQYDVETSEAVVADSLELSLAEIDAIKAHVWNMAMPCEGYAPNKHIESVKLKEELRDNIELLVGSAPASWSDALLVRKMGGLDLDGLVKPIDDWLAFTLFESKIRALPQY